MMAHAAKFLFEDSFDERPAAERAQADAEAAARAKLQAEIEAAHARGREAGLAEAAASIEQRLIDATAGLTEQIARIEQARAEIEASTTASAVRLAMAALRKLLPALERHCALAEVEAVFADCLHRLRDEPRVVLRVPDALLDPMQARVDDAARRAGFHGKVVLLTDDGLGASDCRIEWADGGAERSLERLCADVEALVRRALHQPDNALPDAAPAASTN